jgi:hypothetical protein
MACPASCCGVEDGAIDTMAFESHDGRITAIYITRNPDKLRDVQF